MLDIDGVWEASYSSPDNEYWEPDEKATLTLKDGSISGFDPFGGKYSGKYEVDPQGRISVSVTVNGNAPDAETIFPGVDYPLDVSLEGLFSSPDHFTASGTVSGVGSLVVGCRRIGDAF